MSLPPTDVFVLFRQMDAKSSPLAMLQRTCSQIGADTTATKPLITAEKKRDDKKEASSSPAAAAPAVAPAAATTAPAEKPTFKPYDLDRKDPPAPAPRAEDPPKERKSPGRSPESRKTPKSDSSTASGSGTSPITRPGAEVLAGVGSKDLAGLGLHKPGALPMPLPPYLPGADAASAALRPTLPGLPGLYSQSGLSAASYLGLPPHRPGEKCASPYCPCAYSSSAHGYGAPCPAGCTQCEHAKSLSSALHGSPYLGLGLNPFYPPTSLGLGLPTAPGAASAGAQPIVCSWMAEGRYCGKRFASTEELMQHLRTHTNLSASDSALSLLHPAYQASLLGAHRSPFAVPPSSLSPLSAARYHPYPKPPSSLGLGAPHPSLAAYAAYSPYGALYARPPTMP
ncbi:Zinc finger protein Noc [Amphibalanus amphitrite]|uniref:Zinc finger protein Noc n=1 Tax=Amphibalanus amphitrite TaxID=1232801 RepID=A0A6A4XAM5_AMPAM|nr:Zinc finger protein Noc [Amphibalanus amphitrite]